MLNFYEVGFLHKLFTIPLSRRSFQADFITNFRKLYSKEETKHHTPSKYAKNRKVLNIKHFSTIKDA